MILHERVIINIHSEITDEKSNLDIELFQHEVNQIKKIVKYEEKMCDDIQENLKEFYKVINTLIFYKNWLKTNGGVKNA